MIIKPNLVVFVLVSSVSLNCLCMQSALVSRSASSGHHQRTHSASSFFDDSAKRSFQLERFSVLRHGGPTTTSTTVSASAPLAVSLASSTSISSQGGLVTHLSDAHNHKWYVGLVWGTLAWITILMQYKFAMPPEDD